MPVDASDAFTLILEPVKSCNLRCRYCYSDGAGAGVMSLHTLQTALAKTTRYAERTGVQGNPYPLARGRTPPGGPRVLQGRDENP